MFQNGGINILFSILRRRRDQDEFVEVISEVESESFRPQSDFGAQRLYNLTP